MEESEISDEILERRDEESFEGLLNIGKDAGVGKLTMMKDPSKSSTSKIVNRIREDSLPNKLRLNVNLMQHGVLGETQFQRDQKASK